MQRIKQLWQSRTPRERLLAGIALAVVAVNVLIYGTIKPYRAYTNELEQEIEGQAALIGKMMRLRDRGTEVERQVALLRQQMEEVRQHLIPGDTPALAASQLQERLQSLASGSGLEVLTTVPLRDEALGEFRKTTVQMTLRGGVPALARFVADVEYGEWRLAVNSLEVRGTYNARVARVQRRNQGGGPSPLTVTLEVSGVMQGGQSS